MEKVKAQLTIVVGFLVISFLFDLQLLNYIALGAGLIFITIPPAGDIIVKAWFKLAQFLGFVNSRILLSAIFFGLLLPISLVYRLFEGDRLKLKRSSHKSTFAERNHLYTKKDLENTW